MASKIMQGDELAVARRARPMSVAGELLWQLLPPLTVGCPGGVLARLDLASGRLRYLIAGHPPPVLLRRGKAVRTLDDVLRMPFGRVASQVPQPAELGEEHLEPGDRILLHSDGVIEARDEAGEEFGVDRLVELAEHAAAAQLPAPETLRRLAHAVRGHRRGELRDDATLMLVEWSGSAAERLLGRPTENGQDRSPSD
jgi:phosphoserine phosphatase RsbU/P